MTTNTQAKKTQNNKRSKKTSIIAVVARLSPNQEARLWRRGLTRWRLRTIESSKILPHIDGDESFLLRLTSSRRRYSSDSGNDGISERAISNLFERQRKWQCQRQCQRQWISWSIPLEKSIKSGNNKSWLSKLMYAVRVCVNILRREDRAFWEHIFLAIARGEHEDLCECVSVWAGVGSGQFGWQH